MKNKADAFDYEQAIKLSCFDEDIITNDRIGDNQFKLSEIVSPDGEWMKKWQPILYKKKKSGEVFLEARYQVENLKKVTGGTSSS
jgi:hypothetical protein